MRRQLLVATVLFVALVGCAPRGAVPEHAATESLECTRWDTGVARCVDKEAGVVCWYDTQCSRGGMSCLPIEQTNLDR